MKLNVGSSYFFKNVKGYKHHDNDVLIILENRLPNNLPLVNFKQDGNDVFIYSNLTKEEWIENTLTVPMKAGKFLVPEFCEYIGFEWEELPKLKECFDNIDEKHSYEKIIYNAYLENGAFFITKKQLNEAYQEYKKYRQYDK